MRAATRRDQGVRNARIGQAAVGLPGARPWLWILPLAFLGLFYLYPLAAIIARGLSSPAADGIGIRQILTAATTLRALWFSTWQAVVSTLCTLAVGLPAAYVFARYRFPAKRLLRTLTLVPFVLPTLVVAAAWQALLGPRGFVNQVLPALSLPPLQFTGTAGAIIAAHVFFNTALVVRLVGDAWAQLHPRVNETAALLGAGPLRRWHRITLPLLTRPIVAAALLVFLFDFTSFGVVLLLGAGRFATLEVEIYLQTVTLFDLRAAAVLSLLQLLLTALVTSAYSSAASRYGATARLGRAATHERWPASGRERLLVALTVGALLAWLVVPLTALALRALFSVEDGRLTLALFTRLASRPRGAALTVAPLLAIRNSLLFAALTAVLSLAVGLPAARAAIGVRRAWLRRLVDVAVMLPLGTSPVTIGFGFILALNLPGWDLRASPVLLPVAHTLVALPLVFRALVGGLQAVPVRLREAAAVLGASPAQRFIHVELPVLGRAVASAALFAAAISLGEFGASALIARPELPTITTAIFRSLSRPGAANYGQGMALATLLMLTTALSVALIERLRVAAARDF
ncbi:MAG: iron ABC transporter permease [Spirochaetaceae bacterium]|nr:iron ABC transporter permease [Spirochaetaceae bacterium]